MQTTWITIPARKVTVHAAAPAYDMPVRQLVCLHQPSTPSTMDTGRVIDLSAWKQAHAQPLTPQAQVVSQPPVSHSSPVLQPLHPMERMEWLATLSVIGTMAVLMWRIFAA